MATGFFKRNAWDPFLLVSQIVAVQAIFYSGLGFWLVIIRSLVHRHISLKFIFNASVHSFTSTAGKLQLVSFLINSLTSSISLWCIVQRAKLCLDFAFTEHFIHFVLCWVTFGFPSSWVWWLMNVVGVLFVSIVSEYLCMRFETKAIPVTSGPGGLT